MSYRQYNNPHALPVSVIQFRLLPLDNNASIRIDKQETENQTTILLASIESEVLSDVQIESALVNAITVSEQNAINRKLQAKSQAQAIPNWASWTEQEALDWLQTNIGDPLNTTIPPNPMTVQQIRAVLVAIVDTMQKQYDAQKAMARMIIALRNKIWSDLEN